VPRIVIQRGEGQGRDLALGGECVVGRHPTATFPIEDTLASRRHLRLFPEGGRWVVEDLGSTNGTRVNGKRVSRHVLSDGDVVGIGTTDLLFVQKDLLGAVRPPGPAKPPAAQAPVAKDARTAPTAPVPRRRRR
jgi:pSer/pThr/pTyr-binding forkhead associated (FHA) protein